MKEEFLQTLKCPKCGKMHFMKKATTGTGQMYDFFTGFFMSDCVYRKPADPVYENGVLVNPEDFVPSHSKTYFECLECGCHFSVLTSYKYNPEMNIENNEVIDEDAEQAKRDAEYKAMQQQLEEERKAREAETKKNCMYSVDKVSADLTVKNDCYLSAVEPISTIASISAKDHKAKIDFGGLTFNLDRTYSEEEIENIKKYFGWTVENLE